ncbi:MAG: XkdX family protein [Sporosarcina sp.]
MAFWKMAFNLKWVTAEQLRLAVKTESNPFGEISTEEYKEITKQDF